MCKYGITEKVLVPVALKPGQDLNLKESYVWEERLVDQCLANLISNLNSSGIWTQDCCCGHGKFVSDILLHNGKLLLFVDNPYPDGTIRIKENSFTDLTIYNSNKRSNDIW